MTPKSLVAILDCLVCIRGDPVTGRLSDYVSHLMCSDMVAVSPETLCMNELGQTHMFNPHYTSNRIDNVFR